MDAPVSTGRSVAIIGAGPAGLYLLAALLKQGAYSQLDVYEAVPAPYGLVRYGVAPDHPKTRTIAKVLARGFESKDVRYFGNVRVGFDVSVEELRGAYDVVAFATGMLGDRALDIPGEDLDGSIGASRMVAWYTGHPDALPMPSLRGITSAAVVGAGNVALDIVRILTKRQSSMQATSMPRYVVESLAESDLTDVHLIARRGPAFAKFTSPELHEIGELGDDVDLVIDPTDLELDAADHAEVESRRMAKTTIKLLTEWRARGLTGAARRIHFHFWRRPEAIIGSDRVTGVEIEPTRGDRPSQMLPVGLIVRAIGYQPHPISGLPPLNDQSIIPSDDGRIDAGLYVTGWLRRGPSGVIGTNRPDANAVAETIAADLNTLPRARGRPDDIGKLLAERGVRVVTWDAWLRIDEHERQLGTRHDCDPIVLHTREAIFDALDTPQPP